jgi:two-component sensor histidine kinase
MIEQDIGKVGSVRPLDLVIESNHRIGNQLGTLAAIVQIQIAAMRTGPELIPREEVMNVLTEMVGKILAVARLHRILVAEPAQGELDLNNVLTEILHEFTTSGVFGDRLHLASTLGSGCLVDPSRAAVLALAFSEILTNALKYAHPTGLPVELTIATASLPDGGVALEIADDGVGFPEGFDELRDAGVGLRLVRSLVETLGGHLETRSSELGLTFSIRLPPNVCAATALPGRAAA